MKKNILIALIILLSAAYVQAQDQYKLAKSSGHLDLKLSGVVVEGYAGSEIIFMTKADPVDKRAEGLTRISSSGLKDNTGLGLSVVEENGVIKVQSLSSSILGESITIKVPENIKITFNPTSAVRGNDVVIDNMKSELEISVAHGNIKLNNNTGPINANALHGEISARFKETVKGPISLVSLHGSVDLSLPVNTKANLDMSTNYGKIFASERFNIALEQPANNPTKPGNPDSRFTTNTITGTDAKFFGTLSSRVAGDAIKGKINGGGVDIILKSTSETIYLRTN